MARAILCNVHAFVTSRIDHSCSILVGLPLDLIGVLTGLFDLLPALLVISPNMPRFLLTCVMSCTGFLSPDAFLYRISALIWRSVTGCAPSYLTDLYWPVSDLASRRALRSSARGELLVPRAHSALKKRRAFSVIGPSTWKELPLTLCLLPQNNMSSFCKLLRHFSLTVAGLRAPLSRFLEGLYINIRNE